MKKSTLVILIALSACKPRAFNSDVKEQLSDKSHSCYVMKSKALVCLSDTSVKSGSGDVKVEPSNSAVINWKKAHVVEEASMGGRGKNGCTYSLVASDRLLIVTQLSKSTTGATCNAKAGVFTSFDTKIGKPCFAHEEKTTGVKYRICYRDLNDASDLPEWGDTTMASGVFVRNTSKNILEVQEADGRGRSSGCVSIYDVSSVLEVKNLNDKCITPDGKYVAQ